MTDKSKLSQVLKTAIKGEEDGYKFYDLLAQKSENVEARRKLEHLRDDEIGHKKTLIEIYGRMVGGEIGELPEKLFRLSLLSSLGIDARK